jgi:APA family basic amino acid/polyamine antiporter
MASEQSTPSTNDSQHQPALLRTMGLGALIIYGVGDMLGAGVYALMGEVAGKMGNAVWLAFIASMVAALLTGLSYASLGSRYPRAGGASYITQRAFNWTFLSYVVGLAVTASGLTSFATQSHAFTRYTLGLLNFSVPGTESTLAAAPPQLWIGLIVAFILALTVINFWGMKESTWLNALCTTIEVSGLLIVIYAGLRFWGSVNYFEVPPPSAESSAPGTLSSLLVLQGAVLTFYAFIGFEDMMNVSEEVKNPRRNFPIAVVAALVITTVIYMAVAVSAVSVSGWRTLSGSTQPLVEVVAQGLPGFPTGVFSFIALFAITNTALLNFIMGSRMVYGMARQGLVPRPLGVVHPQRRTPHRAILVLALIVLGLAMWGNIGQLASATSMLLLTVFVVVNAALIVLKRRPDEKPGAYEIPIFVPIGGIVVCLTMLGAALTDPSKRVSVFIALALLAAIGVLYSVLKPKNAVVEDIEIDE